MGLLDTLLGKKKLKGASLDRLFALSTRSVTLEVELGLRPAGAGRGRLQAALGGRVRAGRERDPGAARGRWRATPAPRCRRQSDTYGYSGWSSATPTSRTSSPAVTSSARSSRRAASASSSSRPSSASTAREPVYLIYGYKRGAFWPFVPTGEDQKRDNAEELRLKNELEKELPIEAGPHPLAGPLRRAAVRARRLAL